MAKHRKHTHRIYHGPKGKETSCYWTVTVTPAKRPITINGNVLDALRATPGVTIGCALSNMVMRNSDNIPHDCHYADVAKTRLYIVDRLKKDGTPAHAVEYFNPYGHIVDANDEGTLKKMVKDQPNIMQRDFRFDTLPKAPTPSKKAKAAAAAAKAKSSDRRKDRSDDSGSPMRARLARGALRRAVKAGRIGAHVARQLNDVAQRASR